MARYFLAAFSLAATVVAGFNSAAEAEEGFIAGLRPDRRPAGAPVLTEFPKDAAWYARALAGVEPPYPASLRFLEDQGGWFTPFDRPGMPAPYDPRGRHAAPKPGAR